MIKINKETSDISYSENDTFKLTVYRKNGGFEEGSELRFIIAQTEESEYIIDKTFNINDNMTFTVTLTNTEKSRLRIGEYKYKMILIKNNTIITRKSGYFTVKWGA